MERNKVAIKVHDLKNLYFKDQCYAVSLNCQTFKVLQDMEMHIKVVHQYFIQSRAWVTGIKAHIDSKIVLISQNTVPNTGGLPIITIIQLQG